MQENIEIKGNLNMPDVSFNASTGKLVIEGRSILENTTRFYKPLLDWIDKYCEEPAENTELHLKLEYFNTSTSKYLLSIFEKIDELYNGGDDVILYWYSSDEDMEDLGKDYEDIVSIPFVFKEFSV